MEHRSSKVFSQTCRLAGVSILFALTVPALPGQITVKAAPDRIYIEEGKGQQQLLNFDFVIENSGNGAATLIRLDLKIFDMEEKMSNILFVDRGGTAPGLDTFLSSSVAPGAKICSFNPFYDFDGEIDLARLEYQFTFSIPGQRRQVVVVSVEPQSHETDLELHLPMRGPVVVNDGHDFLAHHRRVDLYLPALKGSGLVANSNRYAYDFVIIDEQGRHHRGVGAILEDWFTWNAPVYVPADGRVVLAVGDFPDNLPNAVGVVAYNARVSPSDISTFAGNHIVIDHGNGQFSSLAHLRRGSVTVEIGQQVTLGQQVARVGLSGATSHVHLHYQLQDGASFGAANGLPSPFHSYKRLLGSQTIEVERGQIDSGDMVEAIVARQGGEK